MPLGWGSRVGKVSSQRAWPDYVCVASAMALLAIWVLPDTIALRHLLLLTGALSAALVIHRSGFLYHRRFLELAPLIALASLFLWVIIHYFAFSLNPELEASEIQSLWARAFLAAMMAIGVRISIATHPGLQPYFFAAFWVIPAINLGAYAYLSWEEGRWLSHFEFVVGFVFKKIEAGFFGVLAIAIACAHISYFFSEAHDRMTRNHALVYGVYGVGISVALVSALVTGTKNGIATGLGLCALLALVMVYRGLSHRAPRQRIRTLLMLVVIVLGMLVIAKGMHRYSAATWNHLLEDIQISSQVDDHSVWKKNNPTQFPLTPSGRMVTGNTYERVAWATMGMRLVAHYPYGYGSVNRSFVGMLNHAGVTHQLESQTHSGWIDFGLGYGVPGLAILALVMVTTGLAGLCAGGLFGRLAVWLTVALLPFGLIAEITYKHNFEILLFCFAFGAACAIRRPSENSA